MPRTFDSSIDQSLLASYELGVGVQELWQHHELFWEQYFPNYEYEWTNLFTDPYGLVLGALRWSTLILARYAHPKYLHGNKNNFAFLRETWPMADAQVQNSR